MKKLILSFPIFFLASLLSNCTLTTGPGPTPYTEYNTGYSGYTVGYMYGAGNDDIGDGTYLGYGGWASSFYSPGYRNGPRGYMPVMR